VVQCAARYWQLKPAPVAKSWKWRTVAHETTTQMTDDERQTWKKRYQDLSVEQLEAALNRVPPHAAEYRPVLREIIDEKRRAAALAGVVALWIQTCRRSQPSAAPASRPAVTTRPPTQAADVNGRQKP
jgi:hypothetical protein